LDDISTGGLFGALLLLIILSAFFSGSETALMTLNRYRLKHLADEGHKAAGLAQRLLERPDRLIGLILLGNNFVNILASSLATVLALRLGGEGAIPLAAGILTLVILIFSEVAPKTLAALHPEKLAFPAAWVYTPLLKVSYPLVALVNFFANSLLRLLRVYPEASGRDTLSKEELRTIVNEAGALIPRRHQKMLLGILDLEKRTGAGPAGDALHPGAGIPRQHRQRGGLHPCAPPDAGAHGRRTHPGEAHQPDPGALLHPRGHPAEYPAAQLPEGQAARELVKTFGWELPTDGPRTFNGLILEQLESIPEPGTSLLINGYPVEILQTQGNAVKTARIHPKARRTA